MVSIVLYYADWCGFCKRMRPVWERVKTDTPYLQFKEVDGDRGDLDPSVTGYPTIIAFSSGRKYTYNGRLDYDSFMAWVRNFL